MPKIRNLKDQTFGDLTVVDLYPKSDKHGRYWLCRCSCGLETVVRSSNLVNGHTKSCGQPKEHNNRLYSSIYKKQMNMCPIAMYPLPIDEEGDIT